MEFRIVLRENHLTQKLIKPHSPEQNGIAEKKISEIYDHLEMKNHQRVLRVLVKFTKNYAMVNDGSINIMRKFSPSSLIFTNINIPESEVILAYIKQRQTERSFRTIKSLLGIRPVYHRKNQ